MMNNFDNEILKTKPLAILTGGLDGALIIVEIIKKTGESKMLLIDSFKYDLTKASVVDKNFLISAVSKHGYREIEHDFINSKVEFDKFIHEVNKIL